MLQIRTFGALNNSSAQNGVINLASGALSFAGSVGETTTKPLNLSGTTNNGIVLANQADSTPLVFTNGVSASGAGSKTLVLGGTSSAANQISGLINQNGGTTSVFKADTGTWVYAPVNPSPVVGGTTTTVTAGGTYSASLVVASTLGIAIGMTVSGTNVPSGSIVTNIVGNTLWLSNSTSTVAVASGTLLTFGSLANFTGNLSISAGTMRLQATSATSDVLSNTSGVVFASDAASPGFGKQNAGGRLEYQAFGGVSTEVAGSLTASAGAASVALPGGGTL
ncbi:MAG: hypothetical protein EBS01_03315, partial [Verrucomicrobia bacterium]|nr:hypothetical protein [Verrucomicrobiota bacterium]